MCHDEYVIPQDQKNVGIINAHDERRHEGIWMVVSFVTEYTVCDGCIIMRGHHHDAAGGGCHLIIIITDHNSFVVVEYIRIGIVVIVVIIITTV